jgi:hypothetical protein
MWWEEASPKGKDFREQKAAPREWGITNEIINQLKI